MTRDLLPALERWLESGRARFGEIEVREGFAGYHLCHVADAGDEALPLFTEASEARQLALLDAEGAYRPLKTAPNLRRGWRLHVRDLAQLREALDAFYPAMAGLLFDYERGAVRPVPLRETLGRQSGMYAVTKRLSDDQAQAAIAGLCRTDGGCLKKILWTIAPGQPVMSLPGEKFDPAATEPGEQPLLCHEACNLLVARAREIVKEAAAAPKVTRDG